MRLTKDVIKQMKFTIEGLDPDLKVLDGNVGRSGGLTNGQGGAPRGLLSTRRRWKKVCRSVPGRSKAC